MKQTIEEAAKEYANKSYSHITKVKSVALSNKIYDKRETCEKSFINGAKSQAAKDFHTQGMYSEEEVKKIALYFFSFNLWPHINTDRPTENNFDIWFTDYKKERNVTT